jgi:hypothetical protein
MALIDQEYRMTPVAELAPHPRNPNEGDVGAIHESIAVNGFWGAVIVQRSTGYVVAGNHRLIAARSLDMTEIPAVWADIDDDAALRILAADNHATRLGHDRPDAIADILIELATTTGLTGTTYDGDDLDDLIASLNSDPPNIPTGHLLILTDDEAANLRSVLEAIDSDPLLSALDGPWRATLLHRLPTIGTPDATPAEHRAAVTRRCRQAEEA